MLFLAMQLSLSVAGLQLMLAAAPASEAACATDLDCSLNGVCTSGACVCDAAWTGPNCNLLHFAASPNVSGSTGEAMANKALCCYHGDDNRSYSWGASVQYAKEDGHYYMWVAEMANHCTIGRCSYAAAHSLHAASFTHRRVVVHTLLFHKPLSFGLETCRYCRASGMQTMTSYTVPARCVPFHF